MLSVRKEGAVLFVEISALKVHETGSNYADVTEGSVAVVAYARRNMA